MRWATILVLLAACGDDEEVLVDAPPGIDAPTGYVPAAAYAVSHDAPGNDEDPAILRAKDGSIYVAWYSQNAGDAVVVAKTIDGVTWTTPSKISTPGGKSFGPTLAQDATGVFHAAWFHWSTNAPPGKIQHAVSTDGITWTNEVDVTAANATDDWVPSLVVAPGGDLVVAFARNTCPPPNTCYGIATARSADGGATWSTPIMAAYPKSGFQHHLPSLVNLGSDLGLAWSPYSSTVGTPWESVQSRAQIAVMRGTGTTWMPMTELTTAMPDSINTFPSLYGDHAGAVQLVFLQATASAQSVVGRPFFGGPSVTATPLPLAGYSPRVVATPTPGVFLGAYVGGPDGQREVFVRVFQQ